MSDEKKVDRMKALRIRVKDKLCKFSTFFYIPVGFNKKVKYDVIFWLGQFDCWHVLCSFSTFVSHFAKDILITKFEPTGLVFKKLFIYDHFFDVSTLFLERSGLIKSFYI